jgi:NAD(P)-dependent dehydrogenase (short-subunit alcohol dehydrogenase family)
MNHCLKGSLKGKVAVVTAGSTGFGRGIAVAYARAGANVVVGDIRESTAPGNFDERPELTTCELIAQSQGSGTYVHCDVTRALDIERLLQTAIDRYGGLDILVNNAGVYRGGALVHEMLVDDLEACWNVIAKGSWFASQAAIKRFLSQGRGGNIINIVSTAGLRAHASQSPYNMAKAAQAALTRCIAVEYASHNIRANGICPTYVKTSMSREGLDGEMRERIAAVIPLHRWGEISDVVNAALYLAADGAAFLTGVLLPVDGGETLSGLLRDADA